MSTQVHVFTDYACPWCYLGWARLQGLAEDWDIDVVPIHFPLSPDTPAEGRDIRAYLSGRGIDVDAARERLAGLLADEGKPYGEHESPRAWNTRLAQELAVWAVEQPGGEAIHDALFHAYHVDNANVSDIEVLVALASGLGLDADAARTVLTERTLKDELDRHWATATQVGVRSVPTFAAGGRGVVGAQPTNLLAGLIRDAGGQLRDLDTP